MANIVATCHFAHIIIIITYTYGHYPHFSRCHGKGGNTNRHLCFTREISVEMWEQSPVSMAFQTALRGSQCCLVVKQLKGSISVSVITPTFFFVLELTLTEFTLSPFFPPTTSKLEKRLAGKGGRKKRLLICLVFDHVMFFKLFQGGSRESIGNCRERMKWGELYRVNKESLSKHLKHDLSSSFNTLCLLHGH